jgi:hypothetical protein
LASGAAATDCDGGSVEAKDWRRLVGEENISSNDLTAPIKAARVAAVFEGGEERGGVASGFKSIKIKIKNNSETVARKVNLI